MDRPFLQPTGYDTTDAAVRTKEGFRDEVVRVALVDQAHTLSRETISMKLQCDFSYCNLFSAESSERSLSAKLAALRFSPLTDQLLRCLPTRTAGTSWQLE